MTIQKYDEMWPLIEDSLYSLAENYMPVIHAQTEAMNLPERETGLLLEIGASILIDNHSLGDIMQREAYWEPDAFTARLDLLVRQGWLTLNEIGRYSFTASGRDTLAALYGAAYTHLATLDVMRKSDLARLNVMLGRLVDACLNTRQPPRNQAIQHQPINRATNHQALGQTNDYLEGLNAYRDDAHLETWRSHRVDGHAWEVLTFVWRGEPHDAMLAYRGFSARQHATALRTLIDLDWLAQDGEAIRLTAAGGQVREEAELLTDTFFFAPWSCLNDIELEDLRWLLGRLRSGLAQANPH